jgi:branched-chain amino acid transport system substrate-binding protein
VLKGMQTLGLSSLPTLTTNGNASFKELSSLSSDLPSQLYFPGAPFMVGPTNLTGQTKTQVQAFDSAIKASGQTAPDEGDALAYDPGLILVSALRKLGTGATAQQIHSYISGLTSFQGIDGTYDFKASQPDNRGLTIKDVYIAEWNKSANDWTAASGPAGEALGTH